ncbi:MAG TPA: hypothetical protein VIG73_04685 [Cerasibacillus sp.]
MSLETLQRAFFASEGSSHVAERIRLQWKVTVALADTFFMNESD